MLFNSYIFLLIFLPVTCVGFFQIGRHSQSLAALWMFFCSLFFYGWWNPAYVGLLLTSIIFNYSVGLALTKTTSKRRQGQRTGLLSFGIAVDLVLLGYYKYTHFVVSNVNSWLGLGWYFESIILPLGISFFTFTQIAFLVDAYRGEVRETNFVHYGLFVTYFPHLIAGPVLHHKEMMPQFKLAATYRLGWENLSVGLTIFALGLFKKVILADGVAPYSNEVFDAVKDGNTVTFVEAWVGALAYSFQLYFDFSGYSDMAIGLSRIFGIWLPLNFNSPYKAHNIIDFWRRWHMTLSRFLRDYLYFALGGNRRGAARRYVNLFLTMLLGGIWHGAGWTFFFWGALHGAFLIVNHAWHRLREWFGVGNSSGSGIAAAGSQILTFLAVCFAWVFFRADTLDSALAIINGLIGLNGVVLPKGLEGLIPSSAVAIIKSFNGDFGTLRFINGGLGGGNMVFGWIIGLWLLVWFGPNTQEIMGGFRPALEPVTVTASLRWRPSTISFLVVGGGLFYALIEMGKVSEFLYFQF